MTPSTYIKLIYAVFLGAYFAFIFKIILLSFSGISFLIINAILINLISMDYKNKLTVKLEYNIKINNENSIATFCGGTNNKELEEIGRNIFESDEFNKLNLRILKDFKCKNTDISIYLKELSQKTPER